MQFPVNRVQLSFSFHFIDIQAATKMKGNNSLHKIRTGDYRIIYEIHDDRVVILIVKVGHRKDVYKCL
ncbi:MAG: type II toxin-antitoxin system RelE/ParE family toxin [Desulfobacula sp.]|nr:type II toxin-antitoxin system RelE/ParE family toxin [Desulfobacula sp.]